MVIAFIDISIQCSYIYKKKINVILTNTPGPVGIKVRQAKFWSKSHFYKLLYTGSRKVQLKSKLISSNF